MERDQSEFNMAVSYLNRLNALFYVAGEAAISLDIYTWWHSLLALQRELSTEMKEAELQEHMTEIVQITEVVNKAVSRQQAGKQAINQDIYTLLHNYELKLRKIMKESGLQNKIMNDPKMAI